MAKQSGYAARLQKRAEQAQLEQQKFTRQLSLDLSMIALNHEFGFGPDRLRKYGQAMIDLFGEYADIWNGDTKDTEYSRDHLDKALMQCLGGEGFQKWEERYA